MHYHTFLSGADLITGYVRHDVPENFDVYERVPYMRHTSFSDEVHVVAFDDQKIVGDLALQPNPDDQDVWWLMHVGVDADYRNQGVARRLLTEAADFVRDSPRSKLSPSSLTDDGEAYLTGILNEIGVRHPGLLTRWNPLQGTLVELYKTRSSDDNDPELSLVGGDDKVILTKENYPSIMHDDLHVCVVNDARRAEWLKGVVTQALKGVVAQDLGNVACAEFMMG